MTHTTYEIQDRHNDHKIWLVTRYACGHYYINQSILGAVIYRSYKRVTRQQLFDIASISVTSLRTIYGGPNMNHLLNSKCLPYDNRLACSEANYQVIKELCIASIDSAPYMQGLYKKLHSEGKLKCNNIAVRFTFDVFWNGCYITGYDTYNLDISDRSLETVLRRIILGNRHI